MLASQDMSPEPSWPPRKSLVRSHISRCGISPAARGSEWLECLAMNLGTWLQDYRTPLLYAVGVLLGLVLWERLARRVRRSRKPAPLHPKLQPYAGRAAADVEADREAAAKIVATSSTGSVAGYEIVQQIEAVFVEGYRTPQEATIALKATAGRKGANAVINLSQQRSGAGRSTSQGDAVLIRPAVAKESKK